MNKLISLLYKHILIILWNICIHFNFLIWINAFDFVKYNFVYFSRISDPGSGTSIDYGKGVAGIKYTFLPELRGSNFIVPPSEIQPAFEETWNGIKAAIAAIEAGK